MEGGRRTCGADSAVTGTSSLYHSEMFPATSSFQAHYYFIAACSIDKAVMMLWGPCEEFFFFFLFLSLPLMTETSRRPLGAKLDGSRRQKVWRGRPSVWRFGLCCPKRSSNPKLLMPQWSCMTPVFRPVTAGIWGSRRAVVGVFVPRPSNHSGAIHPTWWAHLQRAQERQRGGSGDGKEPGCKEIWS